MSGVFWEAEKQPNLCEAASGFTLSTLNLMVALPMAVVDLLVDLVDVMMYLMDLMDLQIRRVVLLAPRLSRQFSRTTCFRRQR